MSVIALLLVSPIAAKYKNCDALRAKFPRGIAESSAKVGTTGATVNKKIYTANRGLDRDKDGVACES